MSLARQFWIASRTLQTWKRKIYSVIPKVLRQIAVVFIVDVVIAATHGSEPADKFGMTGLSPEELAAAVSWLDSLPLITFDDTLTLRTNLENFLSKNSDGLTKMACMHLIVICFSRLVRFELVGLELLSTKDVVRSKSMPWHYEKNKW